MPKIPLKAAEDADHHSALDDPDLGNALHHDPDLGPDPDLGTDPGPPPQRQVGKTKGFIASTAAKMSAASGTGGASATEAAGGDIPTGVAYPTSTRWTANPTSADAATGAAAGSPAVVGEAPRKPPAVPPRKPPGRPPRVLKANERTCKFEHVSEEEDEMSMAKVPTGFMCVG